MIASRVRVRMNRAQAGQQAPAAVSNTATAAGLYAATGAPVPVITEVAGSGSAADQQADLAAAFGHLEHGDPGVGRTAQPFARADVEAAAVARAGEHAGFHLSF